MSDNRRVGGKANDGKNGTRRRKYLRLKKKLREQAKKEAGLKLSNKKSKATDKLKATAKKTTTKKATPKKATTKK